MGAWQQLVIEGPSHEARGFAAGVLAEAGAPEGCAYWGEDLGLEHHTLRQRLATMLRGESHDELFVPEQFADAVVDALRRGGAAVGLVLAARRRVRSARFAFHADTPSRDARDRIRGTLVESLPTGAGLDDLAEEEVEDPGARGVELYTPAPEYRYRIRGTVSGDPGAVFATYRAARDIDFVHVDALHVETIPY